MKLLPLVYCSLLQSQLLTIILQASRLTKFGAEIVNIFLSISLNMGTQKNRLIETFLLSTHNICFGLGIRKSFFDSKLLSGGLKFISSNWTG